MKKGNLIKSYKNYVLMIIAGVLTIANVVITIGGVGSGMLISDLQKKESLLAEQKRELQDQLVKSLSLSDLQEKSESLGFVKPVTAIYLPQTASVARLP